MEILVKISEWSGADGARSITPSWWQGGWESRHSLLHFWTKPQRPHVLFFRLGSVFQFLRTIYIHNSFTLVPILSSYFRKNAPFLSYLLVLSCQNQLGYLFDSWWDVNVFIVKLKISHEEMNVRCVLFCCALYITSAELVYVRTFRTNCMFMTNCMFNYV